MRGLGCEKWLCLGAIFWCVLMNCHASAAVTLSSLDGRVSATIGIDDSGALTYSVQRDKFEVVAPSRIGITISGVDLGTKAALGVGKESEVDQSYFILGGKKTSRHHARLLSLPILRGGVQAFTLEAQITNDGFAWRILIADTKAQHIDGEATTWTLPKGSLVWYFERNSDWKLKSAAGVWTSAPVETMQTVSAQGPVQGLPLVIELPAAKGYLLITEGALFNYSGLRLRAVGKRSFTADFSEAKGGFDVENGVTTPWRVTVVVPDLDRLVNTDLITGLCPAPDPKLFADLSYIKPGRCVWSWWSDGTGTPAQEARYIDDAATLGFEYSLIDDGWKQWPDAWTEVAKLVAYAQKKKVGIFLWKDYNDMKSPAENYYTLRVFLDTAHKAGIAGVKIDFLNSEAKDHIDFTTTALKFAAERRLMINFHGVNKPTGEDRTYPNQISREGIRGLELNKMPEGPITAAHNAALPFTRFVVGPGDYTPLGYSNPGATTWAHQLATVVAFTSPLQVLAENPALILRSEATRPALDVLKAIPATWDETRILPQSKIGRIAFLARRSGRDWFLVAINGNEATQLTAPDLGFLGSAPHRAVLLTSPQPKIFSREEQAVFTPSKIFPLTLPPGGGWVCWLRE